MASKPQPPTQINVLVIEKKVGIESPNLLENPALE
jgi:hypothetical protein